MQNETRALALLARIIGRRHGIEVVFSQYANTASTDGKTITLPLVANLGTEDHAALVEGLVDHEAMHCRFTDFSVDPGETPIVASLSNLIEDVWGEREQAKIYPGCARNIRKSMEVMIRLGWYSGPEAGQPEPPAMMVTNWLVNAMLARLYGAEVLPALRDFALQYQAQLEAVLGPDLVARLWETACEVDAVESTETAVELARRIVALLQEAGQPQGGQGEEKQDGQGNDQQQGQGQGQGGAEGQSGQQGSQGSGSNDASGGSDQAQRPGSQGGQSSQSSKDRGESGDGSQGQGSSPDGGDDGSQQGGGAGGSGGSSSSGSQSNPSPGNGDGNDKGQSHQPQEPGGPQSGADAVGQGQPDPRAQFINQVLSASKDEAGSGDLAAKLMAALSGDGKAGKEADRASHATFNEGGTAGGGADPGFPNVRLTPVEQHAWHQHHKAALEIARPIEVKLGTRLESLLEARTDTFVLHKRAGRRLESRRAPRIALGKLDVFRTVEESEDVDTAVLMLMDSSASMFNNFAGTARRISDVAGPETRIAAAAGVTYAASQVLDRHDIPFAIAGFGARFMPIKTFDQRWATVRRYSMTEPLGGTATDCAILRIAEALAARPENRKLVVLVTDGEPHDEDGTVVVMNEVRRLGVEFACLFIGYQGKTFELKLRSAGYQVSRALSKDSLANGFFEAIEQAF